MPELTYNHARKFVENYCAQIPPPGFKKDPGQAQHKAAKRLLDAGITESDLESLNDPGHADLQDRIDKLIYNARPKSERGTLIRVKTPARAKLEAVRRAMQAELESVSLSGAIDAACSDWLERRGIE